MRKLFLGTVAVSMLVSGVAMADAIADRKAVMKEKVGASMGVLVKTVKGEMAYDAEAVKAAFTTMREGTNGFADLFPEGSESGGKTTADPKIWSDMDGFKAALAKFHGDLDEAIAANPADKDAYMPVFGKVAANCKACHETYRVPQ
eukprot:TRINITY_DN94823_c0_g1_i1.p4 TRINITY_DN94823_c0_g1~~TRINITY_DN94823_c0_g1_i1.p4  ORF type:complete len:146 (-),score=28.00 TRINITY_DN94823_c0_g1_i1:437-874(-)